MQGERLDLSTTLWGGSAAVTPEIRERTSVANVAEMWPRQRHLSGAEPMLSHRRVHRMIAGHLAGVAGGTLRAVVDRRYPLAEAAAAHAYVESRGAFGRVLLVP